MDACERLREALCHPRFDTARRMTYVALDVPSWAEAERWVRLFGEAVDGYKVGLELYFGDGPRALERLAALGKRVFLDVKLHDIPNTVAGALRSIIGVWPGLEMVNVHALGGEAMLAAAREAVAATCGQGPRPRLVAVTLLTSMDQVAASAVGLAREPVDTVVRLTRLAVRSGLDGVVASARELNWLREEVPPGFERVVPGTRPAGAEAHDQARSATPGEAVAGGATRLVLGRAVLRAARPLEALHAIWEEITRAAGAG
ncbi:MAG: orotidine-5'-phosphate decarboxylase [Alicyclobacillaceae bacterium]|nr:orotidine-5'-phosphate decarboxylase [Alicyclobacillaceae bacterium]